MSTLGDTKMHVRGYHDSSYLFQAFLDECEQACRRVHDKEFELTEAI